LERATKARGQDRAAQRWGRSRSKMILCVERDSLRQEYQETVQKLRASIRDLVLLVDNSAADPDFKLAHLRIRIAQLACDVARDVLEHHEAEHAR
jgi:hypothetical protein